MVSRKIEVIYQISKQSQSNCQTPGNCICEEASFYATIRFRTSCGVETGLTGHLRNSMNWECQNGNNTNILIFYTGMGRTRSYVPLHRHRTACKRTEKKKYLHVAGHCNRSGSAKKNGERT